MGILDRKPDLRQHEPDNQSSRSIVAHIPGLWYTIGTFVLYAHYVKLATLRSKIDASIDQIIRPFLNFVTSNSKIHDYFCVVEERDVVL